MHPIPNAIAVHRGGTVTYWDPHRGVQAHATSIADRVWRAISPGERERVLHALRGHRITHPCSGGIWIGDRIGTAGNGLTAQQARHLLRASAALRRAAKTQQA